MPKEQPTKGKPAPEFHPAVDEVLAGMADLKDEEPVKPAAEKKGDEEPEAEAEGESEEGEGEEGEEAEEEKSDKEKGDEPDESNLSKRLEQVRRSEQRGKEAVDRYTREKKAELTKERADIEKEKAAFVAEWKPQVEAAQAYQVAKKRAKVDPVGMLRSLGLSDEDMEHVVRQAAPFTAAAKGKPEYQAAAERDRGNREIQDQLAAIQRELAEQKEGLARERQALEIERRVETYMGTVVKAVSGDAPLVKKQLAKNPDRTWAMLRTVAERIANETGETPEPAEVVQRLEEQRRAELEELGVELPGASKKDDSKKQDPEAGEKRRPSLSGEIGSRTKPREAPQNREEEYEDTLRGMKDLG